MQSTPELRPRALLGKTPGANPCCPQRGARRETRLLYLAALSLGLLLHDGVWLNKQVRGFRICPTRGSVGWDTEFGRRTWEEGRAQLTHRA